MKVDIVEEMELNMGKPNKAQKEENTAQMEKKIVTPDAAILAIATSSYKKGRWYRMTRK